MPLTFALIVISGYIGSFIVLVPGAQTFESSPYYMYHPRAIGRIASDLPGVKLIVLVRDPVERAYSQHAHEIARLGAHGPDLDSAMDRGRHIEGETLQAGTRRLGYELVVEEFVKAGDAETDGVDNIPIRPDVEAEIGLGLQLRVVAWNALRCAHDCIVDDEKIE